MIEASKIKETRQPALSLQHSRTSPPRSGSLFPPGTRPTFDTALRYMQSRRHVPRRRQGSGGFALLAGLVLLSTLLLPAGAIHHMKRAPLAFVAPRNSNRPLSIMNQCPETIWPGIGTQAGTGPSSQVRDMPFS